MKGMKLSKFIPALCFSLLCFQKSVVATTPPQWETDLNCSISSVNVDFSSGGVVTKTIPLTTETNGNLTGEAVIQLGHDLDIELLSLFTPTFNPTKYPLLEGIVFLRRTNVDGTIDILAKAAADSWTMTVVYRNLDELKAQLDRRDSFQTFELWIENSFLYTLAERSGYSYDLNKASKNGIFPPNSPWAFSVLCGVKKK